MYKIISSADPKYIAASDIMIGDMSNINYEFLVFDRPLILLSNAWLMNNFPDIGIKCDLTSLHKAIIRSLNLPAEFSAQRKYWLEKTIHNPDGNSSIRIIKKVIECSGYDDPSFLLLHGDEEVLKTHLDPLQKELQNKGIPVEYKNYYSKSKIINSEQLIIVSAYNGFLQGIHEGFKVHIDHDVKGPGTTVLSKQIIQYKENAYHPSTDLHVTEGLVSLEHTQKLLGPYGDRVIMVGYSKSDTLIELNDPETKRRVCLELGFDSSKPLITYAPAGKYKYPFKQGASLNHKVLMHLKKLARNNDFNVLVKLKLLPKWHPERIAAKIRRYFA